MSDKIYIPARHNTKERTSLARWLAKGDKELEEKLLEILFKESDIE